MTKNILASLLLTLACTASFAASGEIVTGSLKANERCELQCYPYYENSCLAIATNDAMTACKSQGLEHCTVTTFRETIRKDFANGCRYGFYSLIEYKGIKTQ